MKNRDQYSCTSNVVKLLKHTSKLGLLQKGVVSPIMVHMIPTHKCQLNCIHCCFRNRQDKLADMPFDVWRTGIDSFIQIGVKAYEFTGGGDPLLWPYLEEAIDYLHHRRRSIGLITNGLGYVGNIGFLDWVRISLNTLDYTDLDMDKFLDACVPITFCYIWNPLSDKHIDGIITFANHYKRICRIAPDCIQPLSDIEKDISHIKERLKEFPDNKYVFLSDFNINTARKGNNCRIHMIKPCFYLDGWVYACPSAELAIENNKCVQESTRICKYDEILQYYSKSAFKTYNFTCSYCKYVQQQEFLEDLLMDTDFNDFA